MPIDPLEGIDWPQRPTAANLGGAITRCRGLRLSLAPIPEQLRHPQVSGLTVISSDTAHVFFDPGLSPLNRLQTVMHEYAHILHGDVGPLERTACARTTFEDPVEERAESTGMRLMGAMRHRQHTSDVLDFLMGTDDSRWL